MANEVFDPVIEVSRPIVALDPIIAAMTRTVVVMDSPITSIARTLTMDSPGSTAYPAGISRTVQALWSAGSDIPASGQLWPRTRQT